ncbi:unnamed protein product [Zymoseptoria tritici ST99CH_1A5]|uniref:Uncharacterized protein n=1 Tax=Zymoseptoria tritici ST99CH_1A5 TaxID=1276529 RepID=A0A1Y6M499_ZYMTR|nr:unnamed protein product [Zymoseptoria tritici ST99CH_1A5]
MWEGRKNRRMTTLYYNTNTNTTLSRNTTLHPYPITPFHRYYNTTLYRAHTTTLRNTNTALRNTNTALRNTNTALRNTNTTLRSTNTLKRICPRPTARFVLGT